MSLVFALVRCKGHLDVVIILLSNKMECGFVWLFNLFLAFSFCYDSIITSVLVTITDIKVSNPVYH